MAAVEGPTRKALEVALGAPGPANDLADKVDLVADVTAGTAEASKAVVLDASSKIDTLDITTPKIGGTAVTSTAAELNQLDTTVLTAGSILADMPTTAGVGITGTADNFASSVQKIGTLFRTTIVIDVDGLNSGGTINDIIGADGAGVAYLGQITAARNGTIFAGSVKCLEVPTGGDPDIDLWAADEATGVEDTLITDLTETQLTDGGDFTAVGEEIGLTAYPTANQYLYLATGAATDATYTAGILVIELWGK